MSDEESGLVASKELDWSLAIPCIIIQSIIYLSWIFRDFECNLFLKNNNEINNTEMCNNSIPLKNDNKSSTSKSKSTQTLPSSQTTNQSDTNTNTNTQTYSESQSNRKQSHVKSANKNNATLINLTTASLSLLTFHSLFFGINRILFHILPINYALIMKDRLLYALTLVFTGRICLYGYYMHRSYITFIGTAMEITQFKYLRLRCIVLTVFIIGSIYFVFAEVYYHEIYLEHLKADKNYENIYGIILWYTAFGVMVLNDTSISFSLMVLFIRKLKWVSMLIDTDDEAFKRQNMKIHKLIKKITILTIVSVITSIITVSLFVIRPAQTFWIIYFDNMINSICLLLLYQFNHKYYKIFCCLCHKFSCC